MASISKRTLANGERRYDVNYRDSRNRNRRKTFTKSKDAQRFVREVETSKERGQFIDPNSGKQLFGAYAHQWFDTQSHYAPATREAMEQRFSCHIEPVLGDVPLRAILPSTIAGWLAGLPLADGTRRVCLAHVSTILEAALADNLITSNPARHRVIRRPKPGKPRVTVWADETVAAVRALLPEHLRIMLDLGIGLGLRQGEILGLSRSDIDFERGLVHVCRQRQDLQNGKAPIFKLPKGDKTRDVPLPPRLKVLISEHLLRHPAITATLPWANESGNPVIVELIVSHTYRNVKQIELTKKGATYAWNQAVKAAGLPLGNRVNGMHMLRHYYASVLLDSGESIRTLSEYLGHSDIRETLETYAHLMPAAQDRTAKAIDANFERLMADASTTTLLAV